ncbi:nuclear transport factor 2 family protein [Rhodococcus rhodochrous]|uniref:nuclear transport factor 2 family protein n=1 Tax=Rhodococcus rhodochrous TaxID=1829 RepID=UPI001E61B4E5|nr:nuclear transport factor 2 family protein [Rhodococcus rhodochrous]
MVARVCEVVNSNTRSALACFGIMGSAHEGDAVSDSNQDEVEAELIGFARGWAEAIVSNDAERIAEFADDDWVMVSESGTESGRRFLSLVASGELTHSAMDTVGEIRVRVHGDTAILTSRVTNTAHFAGEQFDADEWTTDVLVRRDGKWRCVLTHTTPARSDTSE